MKTILVTNLKGGCGKTTIATTLAAALAQAGERAAIADADPQRAALTWLGQRPARAPRIEAMDWSRGEIAAAPLTATDAGVDRLIIDASPALWLHPGAALAQIDLVIAPTTPSRFDAQATLGFLARIESVQATRPAGAGTGPALWLLGNQLRKRRGPRGRLDPRLAREVGGAIDGAGELSDHARYVQLAGRGLSIFDAADEKAARLRGEWADLLQAIGVDPGAIEARLEHSAAVGTADLEPSPAPVAGGAPPLNRRPRAFGALAEA